MSDKISEFVKGLDQTGVPITLNLNGETTRKTFVGGCCSLMVILLILVIFGAEINNLFFNHSF